MKKSTDRNTISKIEKSSWDMNVLRFLFELVVVAIGLTLSYIVIIYIADFLKVKPFCDNGIVSEDCIRCP